MDQLQMVKGFNVLHGLGAKKEKGLEAALDPKNQFGTQPFKELCRCDGIQIH